MNVWEETNFRAVFVFGHIWTWRPGRTYSTTESVQGRVITRATYWKNPGRVMKEAGHNRCCVRRRCEYRLFASDCAEPASWPLTDLMQCKRFHKQSGLSHAYWHNLLTFTAWISSVLPSEKHFKHLSFLAAFWLAMSRVRSSMFSSALDFVGETMFYVHDYSGVLLNAHGFRTLVSCR
jgi:hypothetical protein